MFLSHRYEGYIVESINEIAVPDVQSLKSLWDTFNKQKVDMLLKLRAADAKDEIGVYTKLEKWIIERTSATQSSNKRTRIEISGHSMGGAIATIAAVHLHTHFPG
jgi:alpha-beta hydrolase superfamily lysophospholipase